MGICVSMSVNMCQIETKECSLGLIVCLTQEKSVDVCGMFAYFMQTYC